MQGNISNESFPDQNVSDMEEDVSTSDVLCINDMIIQKNSTNWYEMTLIDDMELTTANVHCVKQEQTDEVSIILPETFEELKEKNKSLQKEAEVLNEKNQSLERLVWKLEAAMTKKDSEMSFLKSKISHADETFVRLNKSSSMMNEALGLGQTDKKGLGFGDLNKVYPTLFNEKSKSSSFIKGETSSMAENTVSGSEEMLSNRSNNILRQKHPQKNRSSDQNCHVIYTSLKANLSGTWYFDSGCSRHMTGTKDFLIDYVSTNGGKVTYGGDAQGKIVGK